MSDNKLLHGATPIDENKKKAVQNTLGRYFQELYFSDKILNFYLVFIKIGLKFDFTNKI